MSIKHLLIALTLSYQFVFLEKNTALDIPVRTGVTITIYYLTYTV